jgi:hypothetical protein
LVIIISHLPAGPTVGDVLVKSLDPPQPARAFDGLPNTCTRGGRLYRDAHSLLRSPEGVM